MKKIIQTILSVLAVALVVYIYTAGFDGEMGMILVAFLVFAPLISLFFALSGRKRLNISISCDAYVNKGSDLKVKVIVEKEGRLPLPIIEIVPYVSEVFDDSGRTYRLSMFSDERAEFTFNVKTKVGGNGAIAVKAAYSCGFLGFMRFRLTKGLPEEVSVGVVPDVPEIKASSQLFRNIADVVMTTDDDEDNDTSMLFSANTAPGCEHREYVQGDPLKRINWKLSSKRDKLMVRLDEAASAVQPLIVLDLFRKKDSQPEYAVITEEKILRAVFGLLGVLVKQGIACTFLYYAGDGTLTLENVDNPDYPAQLLLKVLAVRVKEERRIVVPMENRSVCACLIATTDAGTGLTEVTDKLDKETSSILGVSAESANVTGLPMWYLDDDETFRMV